MDSIKVNIKLILILCLLYCIIKTVNSTRIKRSLVYPPPKSKIQLIFGAGFPVDESITIGYVIRCDYRLPTNNSDLNNQIITSNERRKIDSTIRMNLYSLLAQLLVKFGGKSCVLKAICELSNTPLNKKIGLFEEIIHLIFTPSTTQKNAQDYLDKDYLAAELLGQTQTGICSTFYPQCTLDLIDLFTKWM